MCQKDSSLLCSGKLFPSLVIPPLALAMLSSSLYLTLRQGVHTTARERYSLLLVSLLPTRPCYRSLPESLSQHLALCTLALLLSRALILVLSALVTDKTLGTNTLGEKNVYVAYTQATVHCWRKERQESRLEQEGRNHEECNLPACFLAQSFTGTMLN